LPGGPELGAGVSGSRRLIRQGSARFACRARLLYLYVFE